MLLGLALFYVGAVLCLNGLWLLGRIGDNEIAIIDYFVGGITLLVSLYLAFAPGADAASIKGAALTLLFTFTYLWVALNRSNGADGRGLGWFCLFVAITAVPVTIQTLQGATTTWGVWFGLCWGAWGFLWFLFFLLLVHKKPIAKFTGAVTVIEGILTGWLPGFLLLNGVLESQFNAAIAEKTSGPPHDACGGSWCPPVRLAPLSMRELPFGGAGRAMWVRAPVQAR